MVVEGDHMKFLKSFISGLFSLVFGILLVITVCVFSVSSFATKENIVSKMKETDILTEVKKIRNSGSSEGNSKLAQVIDEMYSLASQFSVDEEVVDGIIDSDITKEIIGDAAGNLTDYIINGADTKALSEDDIYNLIDDNLDDILDENDIKIDKGQKEKFLREVKKQLPDIVEVIPTSKELMNNSYADNIKIFQTVFGTNTKIVLCVSLAISALIVIILKRKEFEWCSNIGVSMLISGLVIIGISLLLPSFALEYLGEAELLGLTTKLTDFLTKPILYSGVVILLISFILFIIYKVAEKRELKKN